MWTCNSDQPLSSCASGITEVGVSFHASPCADHPHCSGLVILTWNTSAVMMRSPTAGSAAVDGAAGVQIAVHKLQNFVFHDEEGLFPAWNATEMQVGTIVSQQSNRTPETTPQCNQAHHSTV